MSRLTQRKKRPLTRDRESYRDDRLIIVACDDTYAPKQYFDFFRRTFTRVQVHVVPTEDGTSTAAQVLNRLLEFDHENDDELWMLLDTDHCVRGSHFSGFIWALKRARKAGVQIALSKPCFELWLLLHHLEETSVQELKNASETEQLLRATVGEYDKTHLKQNHYPLAAVVEACHRAERLDKSIKGGDKPNGNTSRVYLLWQSIVSRALPSQLPNELVALRQ